MSLDSVLAYGVYRLDVLFSEAYREEVDDFDLPQWTRNTGTLAISVRIPPNTTVSTCRKMLQQLLAERFHAVTAVETRDVLRYHLKVAKSGFKLRAASPPIDPANVVKSEVKDGVARNTFQGASMARIVNSLGAHASIDAFANSLRLAEVGGIVDDTGLTGTYDGVFELRSSVASRREELAESLADAVTRQLGLTLELRRAPGKVLVLRSSDQVPTEN